MYFIRISLLSTLVFVSNSLVAQEAASAKPPVNSFLMQLPVMLLIFALIYFMVIAPQKKHQKKQQELVNSLNKGDEVIVAGGLIGTIVGLTEKVVSLEVSPGVELKVLRSQVQGHFKIKEA